MDKFILASDYFLMLLLFSFNLVLFLRVVWPPLFFTKIEMYFGSKWIIQTQALYKSHLNDMMVGVLYLSFQGRQHLYRIRP